MRSSTLGFSPVESKLYADFLISNYPGDQAEKTAIISTIPVEVAKSFLIKSNLGKHSQSRKVFTDIDTALLWLSCENKYFSMIKKSLEILNTT